MKEGIFNSIVTVVLLKTNHMLNSITTNNILAVIVRATNNRSTSFLTTLSWLVLKRWRAAKV